MCDTVLEAAKEQCDEEMITRLLGGIMSTMLPVARHYHKKKCCYPHYVNPKCIAQTLDKAKQTTAYKKIILQIIHEHRDAIVIDNEMILLSSFRR